MQEQDKAVQKCLNLIILQNYIISGFYWIQDDVDCIYQNIEEYYQIKRQNILIVFNNMIADMHSNKNLNPR